MDTTDLEISCKYSICYGFWDWDIHSYMLQPEQSEFLLEKLTHLVVCAFSTRQIFVALFHSVYVGTRFPP
jgi:hypothetical protein